MAKPTVLPETLVKKMDIAKRICEPLNDKRFKWERDANDENLYHLIGVKSQVTYRDVADGKNKKGFTVKNEKGTKTMQATTLNVGMFLRPFRNELFEALEPVAENVKETEAVA